MVSEGLGHFAEKLKSFVRSITRRNFFFGHFTINLNRLTCGSFGKVNAKIMKEDN